MLNSTYNIFDCKITFTLSLTSQFPEAPRFPFVKTQVFLFS